MVPACDLDKEVICFFAVKLQIQPNYDDFTYFKRMLNSEG